MGTKNNPGEFDCYAKAHPDEPLFVLRANDPLAPALVGIWATLAEQQGVDPVKVAEAKNCANAMAEWYEYERPKVKG